MTYSMEELLPKDLAWQIAGKIMGFKNLEYRITDKGEILFGDVFTASGEWVNGEVPNYPTCAQAMLVVETNLNAIPPDRAC